MSRSSSNSLRRVSSWQDIVWRLGALGSSLKYHVLIIASVALFAGAVTGAEWVVVVTVVLGGRIAQNLREGGGATAPVP
mgnify:CR=1 FL=1